MINITQAGSSNVDSKKGKKNLTQAGSLNVDSKKGKKNLTQTGSSNIGNGLDMDFSNIKDNKKNSNIKDNKKNSNIKDTGKTTVTNKSNIDTNTTNRANSNIKDTGKTFNKNIFKKSWNSPERLAAAKKYGIENYTGTKEQNLLLLSKLKSNQIKDNKTNSNIKDAGKTTVTNKSNIDTNTTDNTVDTNTTDNTKDVNKKETATIDTLLSDVETNMKKRKNEGSEEGKNVAEEKLGESINNFKDEVTNVNENKNEIINKAAIKESEELKRQKQKARDRIASREKELGRILSDAEKRDENRRAELEATLANVKKISARESNIAAAVAGQGGVTLPLGEMESIRKDIMGKYARNITEAERAMIKNKTELDKTLKETQLGIFNEQKVLDKYSDLLDTKEGAPLIKVIQAAANGDVAAKNKILEFETAYIKKIADEQSNRANKRKRNIETEEQWKALTEQEKIDTLMDELEGIQGSGFSSDAIRGLINTYAGQGLSYEEIRGKARKIMALNNDAIIKANTIFRTDPSKWTDKMKSFIEDTLTPYEVSKKQGNPTKEETIAEKEKTKTEDKKRATPTIDQEKYKELLTQVKQIVKDDLPNLKKLQKNDPEQYNAKINKYKKYIKYLDTIKA